MGVKGSKGRKWVGGSSGDYGYKRLEGPVLLTPKGHLPVWVGVDEERSRRFMVHIKALRDAHFCELLRKSSEEYGFKNDGVLRIHLEPLAFEDWIVTRYKANTNTTLRLKSVPPFQGRLGISSNFKLIFPKKLSPQGIQLYCKGKDA